MTTDSGWFGAPGTAPADAAPADATSGQPSPDPGQPDYRVRAQGRAGSGRAGSPGLPAPAPRDSRARTSQRGTPASASWTPRPQAGPGHHDQAEAGDGPHQRPREGGMPTTYPIVAQHELEDPVGRGPMGLLKRRENTEIPKIKPHEVLVWRVGGRYVVDRRELRSRDDIVVRASSVSVVSIRPATEVAVSFLVDSMDAAEFTVKVTFICSVVDPVMVVRDGQVDASDALLAYLRGYQDLFQLGLGHRLSEVNKVRTEMAFQVKAYMAQRPPRIPGMAITSATVQVVTPVPLSRISEIDAEQKVELAKRLGEAHIADKWQDHVLRAKDKMTRAIGDSPRDAIDYAHAEGGLSSQEYAERMHGIGETREQREQIEQMTERTRRHELEDRREEREHERELWRRQQEEEQRKLDREDRQGQLTANIELLKLLAENGHLDTYNADIEDLIRRVRGDSGAPGIAGEQRSELPGGQAQRQPEPEARDDY